MMRIAALTVLWLVWCHPAFAGVVFEMETKNHDRPESSAEVTRIVVDGPNVQMGEVADNRSSRGHMVYRGSRQEAMVVDHDRKSYYLIDKNQAREMGRQANRGMQEYEAMLKDVPPEKRALLEQMMKGRMPAQPQSKPEIRKTGNRKRINGFPCRQYEVLEDGRKTREFWVTDWKNLEGGKDVAKTFEELSEFMAHLRGGGATASGGRGKAQNPLAYMKEVNGFPVLVNEYGPDGSLMRASQLRSVQRQKIDPAAFNPPKGYQQRQMKDRR